MNEVAADWRGGADQMQGRHLDAACSAGDFVPRHTTCDVLVLDARLRQSLVTVRSLGGRGLRVAALGTRGDLPTFSSRWCRQAFICPACEGTDEYAAYLIRRLDEAGARVVIASSDATVALIRRHRQQLEPRVQIALAQEPALAIAANKEYTLEAARCLGLNTPRAVRVESVGDIPAALREIGLPAIVKPVESWVWGEQRGRGLASRLVITQDEARRRVEELADSGAPMLFQQYLAGRREAVMLLYAHGEMYARFAQWAKRTVPPLGGVSVLRQSIAVPEDTGAHAERLVRAIDLEGYSEVEFRRDGEGKPYLMEINPRLSASVELAVRTGVDFPYLLYQWACGDRIATAHSYRIGSWMRYLGGDLVTTWAAMRSERGRPGVPPPSRAILSFCLAFLTPAAHDYVDWRDPLPAWTALVDFVRDHVVRHRGFGGS